MARTSWLKHVVQRVSKSSQATSRKRPAFSLVRMEFLEDRTAPATLDWTGAAGSNWNNAGNWTGGGVPSATNNVLNFNSATAANFTSTNDIAGLTGMTINITDASAASDFTIGGANVGLTNLSNNKTDGAASATTVSLQLTGAGATITATAGRLAISNTANVFDAASTVTVPTGATLDVTVRPSGSLGSAAINPTGGTVNFTSAPPVETLNVLKESWYSTGITSAATAMVDNMAATPNAGLLTATPQGTKFLTVPLDFLRNPSFQDETASPLTGTPLTATDNFGFLWAGTFTAVTGGTYHFGTGFGGSIAGSPDLTDDYISIYVDMNNDGTFTSAERLSNATYNGSNEGPAVTFAAGEKHKIAIGFLEWTGGEFGSASFLIEGDPNFGSQTIINPGDPLQAGMWSFVDKPANNVGTLTNSVNASGSSTLTFASFIDGVTLANLTMAGGAALNIVPTGAQSVIFSGTTSLGGDATFSTGGSSTLTLTGAVSQTAAAGITKLGTGTLNLNAANTYSGATTISAGTVAVASGGLGAATGAADGTTVAAGARLVLKATYAGSENLFLNGTGTTATNGAFATDGTATDKTFSGPITLQSNAWISNAANNLILTGGITIGANQLTTAGAGNIRVQTVGITGSGKLVKVEGGTTRLEVASPNLTGDINVTAGTLRINADGALGAISAPTNVSAGATLRFSVTYPTLEPFNIAGPGVGNVGAINATDANVTLASPITLTGSATIGAAANKLTLNGPLTLGLESTLTFTGAGNIDVAQGFGNGSTPVAGPTNALKQGFLHQSDAAIRIQGNLDGVGAPPGNGGLVSPSTVFEGSGFLTGPLNVGDTQDQATPATANGTATSFSTLFGLPAINIINFNVLWSGQMVVTAPGTYQFGFGNQGSLTGLITPDAQGRLYLDLDKNGIFEDATGEKILTSDSAIVTSASIPLAAGTYNIAIPFTNGGGSGGIGVAFSANDGATWQVINPGLGAVANTRFQVGTIKPNNNVIKDGSGTVTLLGNNTYNGTTTVNSGSLVAATATALGSTTGVTVKSGGTLGLQGGLNLSVPISIVGPGAGGIGALNNVGGTNTIAGPLTISGNTTIGAAGGTLNLNGAINLALIADLTFTGAGNINVAQAFGNGSAAVTTNALQASYLHETNGTIRIQGNLDGVGVAPGNGGLAAPGKVFEGSRSFTGPLSFADPADVSTGAPGTFGALFGVANLNIANFNVLFAGKLNVPAGGGTYRFGWGSQGGSGVNQTEAEGRVYLDMDRNGIFEDDTGEKLLSGAGTTSMDSGVTLAQGSYNIAIPYTNGGGSGNVGLSWSADDGTTWKAVNPGDPSQAGVWTISVTPTNNVVKNGAGTLTFMASNTYGGNTTVNGGTLATTTNNALGNNPASTLTVSGPTTALNLFDSASAVTTVGKADFGAGSGTVNTGAAGGKLAIKTQLRLAGGSTATGDMIAQGANLVDNSAPRTLTAVSGTLTLANVASSTIAKTTKAGAPDNGTLFAYNGSATFSAAELTRTNTYTVAADADVLVVSIASRQNTANTVPTVTYDGTPMLQASLSQGLVGNFHNSSVWYLYKDSFSTGLGLPLVVEFPAGAVVNDSINIYAQSLKGIDLTAVPLAGKVANPEITSTSQTVTVNNVPAGSWAVATFNYRPGTGPVHMAVNNGTLETGGQTALLTNPGAGVGNGDYWYASTTNMIATGGLSSNLSAGSVTFTNSSATANGSNHWNGAVAVFVPSTTPAPISLPATTLNLTAGAILSINSPGDNVIGNIIYNGNAGIIAGANPPTSLTVGSVSSPGAGMLAIGNNIGLKFTPGSTYTADLNGTSAGTQYDQLNVTGAVNLTGASLSVATGFTPALGNSFTIIANDGADPVTGTFTGLAQGATVSAGANNFTISYTGGDGNDVVLTAAAASTATTTTLQANPQATTGGSLVTFTATIAPSPGSAGTVTFLDNGVAIPGGSNVAVSGGQAVFSTSTLAVGVHPVTAAFSGGGGFGASTSAPVDVTITSGATPPTVTSFTINGTAPGFGGVQRSRVVDLTIVFDQAVQLDADVVTLALHPNVDFGGPQPGGVGALPTITVTPSSDNKTFTVTFSGANTVVDPGADGFQSLKDGVYDYTIVASKVHPLGVPGTNMAANSTGTFHRLFGDINAPTQTGNSFTAVVNTGDNLQFRNAFNKPVGGGYLPYFDVNGDGTINSGDNLQFRNRFNKALTWTV